MICFFCELFNACMCLMCLCVLFPVLCVMSYASVCYDVVCLRVDCLCLMCLCGLLEAYCVASYVFVCVGACACVCDVVCLCMLCSVN